MDKVALRKDVLAKRFALTDAVIQGKSQKICEQVLKTVDWQKIAKVHIYKSRADWKEVDNTVLVDYLQQKQPHLLIIQPGNKHDEPIPKQKFDLVIVPTLAFDRNLNRLGWGGGWYDRFLAAQPQALKIGLCFSEFELEQVPTEPHDVKLDQIITESKIY